MINRRLLQISALAISALLSQSLRAQCGSDILRERLRTQFPENIELENQMNAAVASMSPVENRAAIYTIPVVFHVIHTNGVENISREQILDQMRVLNQDYNLLNPNLSKLRSVFKGLEADCQIKFELATIDPNGKCFDGINRVYSPVGNNHDMTNEQAKKLVIWDYKKYLNIWVVTNIVSADASGQILGYAVFPFNNNPNGDGIVVRHDRVGTIGTAVASDSGRTLTHEVGHWLGLFHTFQGGCQDQDLIDDTPPVESTFTNANCPTNGNSCTNDSPDKPDMWENYMDYSNGSCQCLFTAKQKVRMHSFLKQSPRSSNVSAANLIATGVTPQALAPVAAFVSSSTTICAGQSVKFYDISCKSDPTAWSWTFTGASQTSSSIANPTVTYQTPGKYQVSLTVQNTKGSNSITKTDYITVLPAQATLKPMYTEGFENGDPTGFTGNTQMMHSSPSGSRFELYTKAAYAGTTSLRAPIITNSGVGNVYSITLPAIDVSTTSGVKFTFMTSYAQPSADVTETLKIFASSDCGGTFNQVIERSGTGLAFTGQTYTSNFVPTANQWKLTGLTSLSSIGLNTSKSLIFRIDVISAGGNPVYIDNINISTFTASTEKIQNNVAHFQIVPNPINDQSVMLIELKEMAETKVRILDMQGRVIHEYSAGLKNPGMHQIDLEGTENLTSGLYLAQLIANHNIVQQTFVVTK